MSDLISRQQAIDALDTIGYDFSESGLSEQELEEVCEAVGNVRQDMISRIKNLPFAEPEVIRCKDCKHHVLHPRMGVLWCTFLHSDMGYDQFCSYAERRGEQE